MTILMADLVVQQQEGGEPGQHITEKAKQLLAEILLPKQITGKHIEKYIKKAMRYGAWRNLSSQTKALLYIAKRFPIFKSQVITKILQQIMILIELQTIKGKAMYYGIITIVKQSLRYIESFVTFNKKSISKILSIGINNLNNPLVYKIYGY